MAEGSDMNEVINVEEGGDPFMVDQKEQPFALFTKGDSIEW